jgi:ABC-type transport system involved in multi-copper enzyme maturation permease subunit
MIWLTWRQHRRQWLYTLIAIAALAAVMVPTGLSMHDDFASSGLQACLAKMGTDQLIAGNLGGCGRLSSEFSSQYSSLTFIAILFVITPVFVGIFYGAPLVAHEIEQGTHRFVWTQGVSRMRWALTKFGVIGLVALALAVVYAIGVTWWSSPLVASGDNGRLNYVSFDVQGVVPIAYTLFAVALGIFLGVYARKVLPAMGITLAGFVVVRVAIEWLARKHYLSPVSLKLPINSTQQYNQYAGDWIYSNSIVSAQGKTLLADAQLQCVNGNVQSLSTSAGSGAIQANANPCADPAYQGAYNLQSYQPGTRFWDFQWIEAGIFIGLAALLIWFALVRLRRIS